MSDDNPLPHLRLDIHHAYEILGLKPGASQKEVKQAYRKLVKVWHPDRFFSQQEKQKAEERIKKINEAYNQLKSYQPIAANESSANYTEIHIHRFDAEAFYELGRENVRKRMYQEAIANFTHAIRLNPKYIKAYKYRGLICSELGYEYRATADLNKAAELEWQLKYPGTKPTPSPKSVSKPASLKHRFCQKIKKLLRFRRKT
ncbi:heat shock protein DnaJ domain-containing protein [Tolypothrix sp. NIES-4075]|uniref:J domain-containing protein n=1 Tax=Tolypothrix sp. NIES-4075 TaxID=2005459 RepID=UPI000B5CCD58|nr:DnaJ domain-containing protein [Tolypothrix sp. NIES-4075]GAX40004.1 heat shock protein DnaJ domain-containing protein [Tolypothrix sp. NIES-4075]